MILNRSEMSDQDGTNVIMDVNCTSAVFSRRWVFLSNRHIPKCSKMCSKWILFFRFCFELFNKFNCFKINFIENIIRPSSYNAETMYQLVSKILPDVVKILYHHIKRSRVFIGAIHIQYSPSKSIWSQPLYRPESDCASIVQVS